MRHSKEGVQGLVAAFDGGEDGADGWRWCWWPKMAESRRFGDFWLQWEGEGCLG